MLRAASAAVLLVLAYYLLPLDADSGGALAWLVGGLVAVAAVLWCQVRANMAARYPRLVGLRRRPAEERTDTGEESQG